MTHAFPWFAVHKTTRHVVAGFGEFDDAERFCAMFKHGMYIVVAGVEMKLAPVSVEEAGRLLASVS